MVNNAIAWAHFQLRGGLKSGLWFCGIYALAVFTFYALARSTDPRGVGRPSGWIQLLLVIQGLALVLFGASRVSAAIRGDITTRMIESHRLMPTSPMMAIAGYLVGGTAQPLMIAATTFVLGVFISTTAGLPNDRWILSNAILLIFAMFVWTLVSLISFITTAKGPMGMGWMMGIFMAITFSQGMITLVLPGAMILASPLMGRSVFVAPGGAAVPSVGYAGALVGQLIIGSLYFIAASRRYRSAELTGFTPLMALLLILTWVALTIFGIVNWDEVRPGFFRTGRINREIIIGQVTVSIAATMLLSLLPLAVSSRAYRDWSERRALRDPGLGRRPLHPALAALICAVAAITIAFCLGDKFIQPLGREYLLARMTFGNRPAAIIVTFMMLLAFTLGASYLFRIIHRRRSRRGIILIGLFMVITWASPIVAEVARNMMSDEQFDFIWTRLAGVSPIGTLILAWGGGGADPAPGALVQLAIAALLATLFYSTNRIASTDALPPLPA